MSVKFAIHHCMEVQGDGHFILGRWLCVEDYLDQILQVSDRALTVSGMVKRMRMANCNALNFQMTPLWYVFPFKRSQGSRAAVRFSISWDRELSTT